MLHICVLDALREGIAPVWSHPNPRIDNCVFCQNVVVAWYIMPGHDDDGAAFPLCAACAAQCGAEGAE